MDEQKRYRPPMRHSVCYAVFTDTSLNKVCARLEGWDPTCGLQQHTDLDSMFMRFGFRMRCPFDSLLSLIVRLAPFGGVPTVNANGISR